MNPKPLDHYEYFELELLYVAIDRFDLDNLDNHLPMTPQRILWRDMWKKDIEEAMMSARTAELLGGTKQ